MVPAHGQIPIIRLKRAPKNKKLAKVLSIFGGIPILGFSSLCTLGALLDLLNHASPDSAVLLVMGTIVSLMSVVAIWMSFRQSTAPQLLLDQEVERALLNIAYQHRGMLTAAQLALLTDLSIEESDVALRELQRRQVADLQLMPDGTTFYAFPAFMSPAQLKAMHHELESREFDDALRGALHADQTRFDFDGDLEQEQQRHAQANQQAAQWHKK